MGKNPRIFLKYQGVRLLWSGLGAGGFGVNAGERGAHVFVGIDWRIADADLVVQVGSGGPAAHSDVADHLAADDGLTSHHGEAGHVGVAGLDIVAVVEDDLAPVSALHGSRLHGAVRGGADGGADGRGDVDAGVELALSVAVDGVFPLTEAAADG